MIVGSVCQKDFLPANWGVQYYPTWVDAASFSARRRVLQRICWFVRFAADNPISEVKAVTPQANPHRPRNGANGN